MISIQDNPDIFPEELTKMFERVRHRADYMPVSQVRNQMRTEFGDQWMSRFASFDEKPFAAASIGQVHMAVLHGGGEVAVKIQYPGVADSIESDLDNLMTTLRVGNLLPKGLFLENFSTVARKELKLECDYERGGFFKIIVIFKI
jgi:aarF domain-containing kinase